MKNCIEVASYSLEWAISAARYGADRIELCDNISEGGTTPSFGLMKQAAQRLSVPVVAMIRPRGGNFMYTESEFDCMKEDIIKAREAGMKGVVFGILSPNNQIDTARNAELAELARPLQCCFHRAFDMTPDPLAALATLIETGFDRVLTSGQKTRAEDGVELIAELVRNARGKIVVMPGAGINPFNILPLALRTGAKEFHLSAKRVDWEEPLNNKTDISFSAPGTRLYMIDSQKVKETKEKMEEIS